MGATPERVCKAHGGYANQAGPAAAPRDRDVGAGAALRSGAQSVPPSSVSGAAPWHWLLQRVGASKWPSTPRRQFIKHVDLRAANFGCGSSLSPSWTHLRPSRPSSVPGRPWSSLVFAGRSVFGLRECTFAKCCTTTVFVLYTGCALISVVQRCIALYSV